MSFSLPMMVFPAAMLWAACADLITMKIPNRLSLLLVATVPVAAWALGMAPMLLLLHLSAALAMLLLGMGLFALGWIGGGDAKMLAAVSAWMGWAGLPAFLLSATLAGGVLTILVLIFRKIDLVGRVKTIPWVARLHSEEQGIPYGIALAIGGLVSFPGTIWMELAVTGQATLL